MNPLLRSHRSSGVSPLSSARVLLPLLGLLPLALGGLAHAAAPEGATDAPPRPDLLATALQKTPSAFTAAPAGLPRIETRGNRSPSVTRDRTGNLVFRNQHLVAVLLKEEHGFGSLVIYPATRPTQLPSEPIAIATSLGTVHWKEGGADHSGVFHPSTIRLSSDRATLTGAVSDGGISWTMRVDLWIGDDAWLSWHAEGKPSAAAGLTRFAPLPLRVGYKGGREAIFPGLEYLEGDEASSSTRDDQTPAHVRRVPDPYKITVPLMAHTQSRATVALLWDNQQDWGGPGYPAALFDSPNRSEGDENTRMELFLPSIPNYVKENEEIAATPLALGAGQSVRLEGKIAVLPEERNPAAAIRTWTQAYGMPITDGIPRSLGEERRLAREAFTRRLWDPARPGWRYALGEGSAEPYPFNVLLLHMDSAQSGKDRTLGDARAQSDQVLAHLRQNGPLEPRLAYRFGGLERSLLLTRGRLLESADEQLAGGFWPWEPAAPEERQLGEPGDQEVGLVTSRALPLLRYALLTGDSNLAGAGLRSLQHIEGRYRVPRGAQSGELPLHAPDLLAAAEAAEAFLLGYRLSGDEHYLTDARYWADTGLPFVYLWGEKDRPALMHATIPAFGASQYTRSWFGKPRQEIGLEYARVLRSLSRVRHDGLYDYVSEGILASAQHQQYESGESTGLLPEAWLIRENRGEGAKINPGLILSTQHRIEDLDTDVSAIRVRVGPDRLFVASGATIHQADTSAFRLRLKLRWIGGEETYTTVSGVTDRPLSVTYNNPSLRQKGIPLKRNFLPEATEAEGPGWSYDPNTATLLLRLRHTGNDDNVEIRWPDPKDRSQVDRVDLKQRQNR